MSAHPIHGPVRLAGWLLLLMAPAALGAQAPFPHQTHDRLFPLCSGCHEVGSDPSASLYPSATLCSECHDGDQAPVVEWSPPGETAGYGHPAHGVGADRLDCEACHTSDGGLGAASMDGCAECHDAHHAGGVHCRVCHDSSPRPDHEARAHAGCAGSGCHEADLVGELSFDRELCLVCHDDKVDHKPGRPCGRCHAVGQPGER